MIFEQDQGNLNAWKTEMHIYEKNKRTKKPFGKTTSQLEYVTHEKVKANECRFNPVLQNYSKPEDQIRALEATQDKRAKSLMNHLKQTVKYEKNFDIVNLKSNQPYNEKTPDRKMGPIRNAYNVINNQKLPQYFFEKRDIRLPVERNKKLLNQNKRQYNIVSNKFKQDHDKKVSDEVQRQQIEANHKYWKTHNYDPVFGKFYDSKKEQNFQLQRSIAEKQHGKDAEQILPPSYVHREPLIIDYSKPLPQKVKEVDERNRNAKRRFETKYVVLDEYSKRNVEDEDKYNDVIKNHVHFGRVLDEKCKEFNIVTNIPYKESRAEDLYGKKLQVQSWDRLLKEASRAPPAKPAIKSGGFS